MAEKISDLQMELRKLDDWDGKAISRSISQLNELVDFWLLERGLNKEPHNKAAISESDFSCPNQLEVMSTSLVNNLNSQIDDDSDDFLAELQELRQVVSVKEYYDEFVRVTTRMKLPDDDYRVYLFMCGLDEEIRCYVNMFDPNNLDNAYSLAIFQEFKLNIQKKNSLAKIEKVETDDGKKRVDFEDDNVSYKVFDEMHNRPFGDDNLAKNHDVLRNEITEVEVSRLLTVSKPKPDLKVNYLSNLVKVTHECAVVSYYGHRVSKVKHQLSIRGNFLSKLCSKFEVFECAHKLFVKSPEPEYESQWAEHTDFYGVCYDVSGRAPPKPPDYTNNLKLSRTFQKTYSNLILAYAVTISDAIEFIWIRRFVGLSNLQLKGNKCEIDIYFSSTYLNALRLVIDMNGSRRIKKHFQVMFWFLDSMIMEHGNSGNRLKTPSRHFMQLKHVFIAGSFSHQRKTLTNQVAHQQMFVYEIPCKILCGGVAVNLNAELDTDEMYAQITLMPEGNQDENKKPSTLELLAKDLCGIEWRFQHIFQGKPWRNFFQSSWSGFVCCKRRLVACDAFRFLTRMRFKVRLVDEKAPQQRVTGSFPIEYNLRSFIGFMGHKQNRMINNIGDTGSQLNGLIVCTSSGAPVHERCYGVQQNGKAGYWLYSWCRLKRGEDNISTDNNCLLCTQHGGSLKLVVGYISDFVPCGVVDKWLKNFEDGLLKVQFEKWRSKLEWKSFAGIKEINDSPQNLQAILMSEKILITFSDIQIDLIRLLKCWRVDVCLKINYDSTGHKFEFWYMQEYIVVKEKSKIHVKGLTKIKLKRNKSFQNWCKIFQHCHEEYM